jgi:hypothetical protein
VLLEELVSEASLDRAYAWLCEQRKAFPENAEVWTFRRRWADDKPRLRADLRVTRYSGSKRYRPVRVRRKQTKDALRRDTPREIRMFLAIGPRGTWMEHDLGRFRPQSTVCPGCVPHPNPSDGRRSVTMRMRWSAAFRPGLPLMTTTSPGLSVSRVTP